MSTNSTTLATLIPEILVEAQFVMQEKTLMKPLIRNYTLGQGQGKTVTVPIYPVQVAAAVAEGATVPATDVTTQSATLSVGISAIRTQLTDLSRHAAQDNVVASIGRLFGEALAKKIDTDILALFSSFAKGVGTYADPLKPADIFNAIAQLRSAGLDTADLFAVIHPNVAYDLQAALTTSGTAPFTANGQSMVANEAMRSGFVGMLGGIPVYSSANVPNNGTAGDYTGVVMHREAIGIATMNDISLEIQREATTISNELVGSTVYGVGILFNDYGRFLKNDSSLV